jgi:NAD(P)-dependent dehydrogenase (short-subunit alcohol dehydrogenase family)
MADSRLSVRDRELFLAEPHIAALSVSAGPVRGPLIAPIWYQYAPGGEAWVLTEAGSRKVRLIEAAGRFTLMAPTVRYVSVPCCPRAFAALPCEDPDALWKEDSEMTERISLEGKVAVVTGAGRGLGRAYVELLAERGARVVVNDLGTDVSGFGKDSMIAEQVADLIRSRGGEAIADDSDVSTPEGGSDLIATTIEHFGRIDLLVNNAGICGSQLFEDATLDDFDHYWRVHLGGPVNTVKAAWPYMVAQRYGKIVLVTSYVGLFGSRGQATYAAAKCAVVGLMRILAIEGAEHGILVNTISPVGYTRMHPAAGSRVSEADGKAATPVEAVAPAIVWLASDGCSDTNRIYHVEAGAIQRIAIVMGPGFYDPHLTPESIAENYAKVESIQGFSEPGPFEPV